MQNDQQSYTWDENTNSRFFSGRMNREVFYVHSLLTILIAYLAQKFLPLLLEEGVFDFLPFPVFKCQVFEVQILKAAARQDLARGPVKLIANILNGVWRLLVAIVQGTDGVKLFQVCRCAFCIPVEGPESVLFHAITSLKDRDTILIFRNLTP